MTRALLAVGLALAAGLMLAVPANSPAQPPPPKPGQPKAEEELVEKVKKAIDGGVRYLRKQQNNNQGNWEGVVLNVLADMEGGATALVTLALLNCGVGPDDPAVARALDYLRRLDPKKTYVVGLQNMVFAEARQAKDLPLIQRNTEWLIDKAIGLKGGQLQGWSYPGNTVADNSNTQYALLGLYAAKQAGARIDDGVWRAIQDYYTRTQGQPTPTTGYWAYHNTARIGDTAPSFTMTVAGVCGLIIAGMGLDQSEQALDDRTGVAANCGLYSENAPVARGMNWIAANFSFTQGKSQFYNIYGIERLGRLSGQRFIGKYDWYREGCEYLTKLAAESPDGSIGNGRGIDGAGLLSTSFSLLFLSKGRTPVLVSKFAWGEFNNVGNGTFAETTVGAGGSINWNRKHNDTRHIVEYASKELFKGVPLAWQVYDVRRQDLPTEEKILGEVGTLLQSPIVYINGHGKLTAGNRLTGVQKKILQKYIEEGGFLVAEACCGDKEFADSFRALMKELFPNNDLRKLPPEHAIWRAHADVSPADFPDLEGLERGCRTVAVFSPSPLAGYWEESRFMPQVGKPAKNRGEKAYKLAANIVAYATGLELPKPKLTTTKVFDPSSVQKNPPRSYFKPVQLKTGGESEPAPAAMRNLMGFLRDNARLEVVLDKEGLSPGDESLFGYKFMYLHGRKELNFGEYDIENLKANLQTGGLLFADAGCNGFDAWRKFDASFRATCEKLFPGHKLEVIERTTRDKDGKEVEEPLYKIAREAGLDLRTVRCRREKPDGSGPESEMRSYPPLLEGVKIDGRWVVVYSKYDVGCALEGHKASDCLGHDKDSAMKLASAVVLYSLKR